MRRELDDAAQHDVGDSGEQYADLRRRDAVLKQLDCGGPNHEARGDQLLLGLGVLDGTAHNERIAHLGARKIDHAHDAHWAATIVMHR